jgi:hypothetical protein
LFSFLIHFITSAMKFAQLKTALRLRPWLGLGAVAIALPLGITVVGPHLTAHGDAGHGDHGAATSPDTHGEGHGEEHEDHGDHGGHGHSALKIPEGVPIPQVSLTVTPDAVRGWNLYIETENWTFAPERVNQASIPTEGHGHLYVNGEKLTRIYGNWYYLEHLPPGEHTVTVGLNANGHEALTVAGEPIEASAVVAVPDAPDEEEAHHH